MSNDLLLNIMPDILWNIIAQLPGEFDSHDVIKSLSDNYPHVYKALKDKYKGEDEATIASSVIARMIKSLCILEGGENESENINGNKTLNRIWKKGIKNEAI